MRNALAAILIVAAGPLWADQVSDLKAGTLNACRGCDLQDADFKKADLSGVDLTGSNLSGASFHRANLRGAILEGVTTALLRAQCFTEPNCRELILMRLT
jgi:uncharacterized protein YjbI with pentapeptide repeats